MNSGVYLIRNVVNGKIYIGSSGNLKRRKRDHWNQLNNNTHKNPNLQNSWNVYGQERFEFEVVFTGISSEIDAVEQYLLNTFVGLEQCFNWAKFVDNPTRGRSLSESHKQKLRGKRGTSPKISEALRKRFSKKEERDKIAKIGRANKGKRYNCDRRGIANSNSKLTIDQVREIRKQFNPEYRHSVRDLSKQYGCSTTQINNIVRGRQWVIQ